MSVCNVCSSDELSEYKKNVTSVYSSKPYSLLRCNNCENIFVDPLPSMDELNDIYKNSYSYDLHSLIQNEKAYRAKKFAEYIIKLGAGNVLEFGCMFGHMLDELTRKGIKNTGVEINKKAAELCIGKGLNVVNTTLEEFVKNNKNKYDTVVMSHVLEHILSPQKQLEIIKTLLSENGKLVLIVPNTNSFTSKIFGKYWGYWQVPVHINNFNDNSITHLLKCAGYGSILSECVGGDSFLFLSTLSNLLKLDSSKEELSDSKISIIKLYSFFVKYWRVLGNDDLVVVASKTH